MQKIFILGIGGLLGSKLAVLARNDFEVYGSYNLRNPELGFVKGVKLNITDATKLKEVISNAHPDILINTCALHNVDYCENHQSEARKINIDAVEHMYKISNSLGAKLVHISSDSVFDGTKDNPYTENDIPKPINFYGYTKMVSEKIVSENPYNLIVRASILYGWLPKALSKLQSSSMKPTNFAQWLISKLNSNERIKAITDEYSSPIIAEDFARSILHLVNANHHGIFHSAPSIKINRYDFSINLAKFLNLDYRLIEPTTTKELGRKVMTGVNKCLSSSKIIKESKFQFLSIEESFNLLREQMYN